MNILWIVNTIFPEASKHLGLSVPVVGGWMYGLAKQVSDSDGVELAVATIYAGNELQRFKIDDVTYYLLPSKCRTGYQRSLEVMWQNICDEFRPDIVHIHGSEFPHGLACMRACPGMKYVVSIQGLTSVYSRYYTAGMSVKDVWSNITVRDILRRDNIYQARNAFKRRGEYEIECLKRSKHIIGRTSWDYAHAKSINSVAEYHFCNESLRDVFYDSKKWDYKDKTDNTIFLSQASYPIKGAHQVIKAVELLRDKIPSIQIRIAGASVIRDGSFKNQLLLSGYGRFLRKLIFGASLENNISFLGSLEEDEMVQEYQKAHIFVCPSCIENSPNSLGEAQLIGTPVVASYVGGISDMVEDHCSGLLYRFEEVEMLAEKIYRIFTDKDLCSTLSANGIKAAVARHDRKVNLNQLLSIYSKVAFK